MKIMSEKEQSVVVERLQKIYEIVTNLNYEIEGLQDYAIKHRLDGLSDNLDTFHVNSSDKEMLEDDIKWARSNSNDEQE